jgi:hypothetical protein
VFVLVTLCYDYTRMLLSRNDEKKLSPLEKEILHEGLYEKNIKV